MRVLNVVASTILIVGCSSNRGTLILENKSAKTIERASVRVCGQAFENKSIRPGGRVAMSYKINCEGDYEIEITLESGMILRSHEGYVTPGVDNEDTALVMDDGIKLVGVSRKVR